MAMQIDNSMILYAMRGAHAERAIAELRSILGTFYVPDDDEKKTCDKIYEFVDWLQNDAPGIS